MPARLSLGQRLFSEHSFATMVTLLVPTVQEAILQKGVDDVWHARLARGDPFEDPLQREQVRFLFCACSTATSP
jgi:hypothetical protein